MKSYFVHWRSPLAVTVLFVLLISTATYFVTSRISDAEEEKSFAALTNEAKTFATSWQQSMDADRNQLQILALAISELIESGLEKVPAFLDAYSNTGTFSRLELLLPDDKIIAADGVHVDQTGHLSFALESQHGIHISDRVTDWDGDGYVVRHFIPIMQDGETVAMFYGVIDLNTLERNLPYTPYGGEAAVYVIDGATGDFLLDTWHQELGNIWELGSRPHAEGYNNDQLRQGLINGESNYVVFVSETTGEYLYFYYAPMGINQWRVALSVPENLVFQDANNIRRLINLLIIIEGILCLGYILWMIQYVRRETGEKQRRLDSLSNVYDVEKLLFNGHEHPENISKALEIIAKMLSAKRVSFTAMPKDGPAERFLWESGGESELGSALLSSAPDLLRYFSAGHKDLCVYTLPNVRAIVPKAPSEMTSLAAIPAEDMEGNILGVLSASGFSKSLGHAAILRSFSFSFVMLCNNLSTYRLMQRKSERDALTGLYNRNRYEQDRRHIAAQCRENLGCLYVDANGLHELNNSRGHEAGDHLLCAVADELCNQFGEAHTYRIGGDEFVVFTLDLPEEEISQRCKAALQSLKKRNYSISFGIAWQALPVTETELASLIKSAEKRMYAAKQIYYSDPTHDRRTR